MFNPKSLDNLQPFDQMDTAKHKAISSKGGLASAKARKARKEEMEMLTAMIRYGDFFRTFLRIADKSPKELERMIRESAK
jgi:hypothetical protein